MDALPGGDALFPTQTTRAGWSNFIFISYFYMDFKPWWPPRQQRRGEGAPLFLPGESQGQGSLVGCRLWGRIESDTTEAT